MGSEAFTPAVAFATCVLKPQTWGCGRSFPSVMNKRGLDISKAVAGCLPHTPNIYYLAFANPNESNLQCAFWNVLSQPCPWDRSLTAVLCLCKAGLVQGPVKSKDVGEGQGRRPSSAVWHPAFMWIPRYTCFGDDSSWCVSKGNCTILSEVGI